MSCIGVRQSFSGSITVLAQYQFEYTPITRHRTCSPKLMASYRKASEVAPWRAKSSHQKSYARTTMPDKSCTLPNLFMCDDFSSKYHTGALLHSSSSSGKGDFPECCWMNDSTALAILSRPPGSPSMQWE
jgi:hypothetical protein